MVTKENIVKLLQLGAEIQRTYQYIGYYGPASECIFSDDAEIDKQIEKEAEEWLVSFNKNL